MFETMCNIVRNNYISKDLFKEKDLLSLFLLTIEKEKENSKGEKSDPTNTTTTTNYRSRSIDGTTIITTNERLLKSATRFFELCNRKQLLDERTDYERLLPVCLYGLSTYPRNQYICKNILSLLDSACTYIIDTTQQPRIVEQSGVMPILSSLLTFDDIPDTGKTKVRTIIGKIIATP